MHHYWKMIRIQSFTINCGYSSSLWVLYREWIEVTFYLVILYNLLTETETIIAFHCIKQVSPGVSVIYLDKLYLVNAAFTLYSASYVLISNVLEHSSSVTSTPMFMFLIFSYIFSGLLVHKDTYIYYGINLLTSHLILTL